MSPPANPYAPPDEARPPPLPDASVERVEGTFHSPLIGVAHAPSGLSGPGWLAASPGGLVVEGRRVSGALVSVFGLLGLLAGFVVGGALSVAVGNAYVAWVGIAASVFGGAAFGRWLGGRKPYRAVIPWHAIRQPALWGPKLELLSQADPKGTIEFTARADQVEALQRTVFHLLPQNAQAQLQEMFRKMG